LKNFKANILVAIKKPINFRIIIQKFILSKISNDKGIVFLALQIYEYLLLCKNEIIIFFIEMKLKIIEL